MPNILTSSIEKYKRVLTDKKISTIFFIDKQYVERVQKRK